MYRGIMERVGWISVKDRLPEKVMANDNLFDLAQEFIVCSNQGVHSGIWQNGEWSETILYNSDYWPWYDLEVTHWMPLPDPPEEA